SVLIEFKEKRNPEDELFAKKTLTEYVNSEGSEKRSHPIVTTELIKKELFDGSSYFSANFLIPELGPNNDTIAYVADSSKPILVDNRIAFFWGIHHLPKDNGAECVELETG
ncbi:hypothetical protein PENTCL1PPCAC_5901, partial [Pristionchus entomophagus]